MAGHFSISHLLRIGKRVIIIRPGNGVLSRSRRELSCIRYITGYRRQSCTHCIGICCIGPATERVYFLAVLCLSRSLSSEYRYRTISKAFRLQYSIIVVSKRDRILFYFRFKLRSICHMAGQFRQSFIFPIESSIIRLPAGERVSILSVSFFCRSRPCICRNIPKVILKHLFAAISVNKCGFTFLSIMHRDFKIPMEAVYLVIDIIVPVLFFNRPLRIYFFIIKASNFVFDRNDRRIQICNRIVVFKVY